MKRYFLLSLLLSSPLVFCSEGSGQVVIPVSSSENSHSDLFFPNSVQGLLDHQEPGYIAVVEKKDDSGEGIFPTTLNAHVERLVADAKDAGLQEAGRQTADKVREAEKLQFNLGKDAGMREAATDQEALIEKAKQEARESAISEAGEKLNQAQSVIVKRGWLVAGGFAGGFVATCLVLRCGLPVSFTK